jgi:hypothetical protein
VRLPADKCLFKPSVAFLIERPVHPMAKTITPLFRASEPAILVSILPYALVKRNCLAP